MRRLALAIPAALLTLPLHAQMKPSAAIPATPPTQSVSDLPSAHPALTPPAPAADVTWNGALLQVKAKGSSLRDILRTVSQETGMKITGGVPEEQVFGNYGPSPVQDVMAQLFEGIAVNMMLLNDSPTRPKELVLTQRNGAATPPQTRPIADDEQGFGRRRGGFGQQRNQAAPPVQAPPPQQQPQAQAPAEQPPTVAYPPGQAAPDAAAATTTPSTDASGQPQSPNGVRTPEQIFEELRKRQQANSTSQ
jgi:hypothetical protein